MRWFRRRVLRAAICMPDDIADQAIALAVALTNPDTTYDERVALRRAFAKRLSTEVWSIRIAAWDAFNDEFWQRYEDLAPTSSRRQA
jgi:hypothetical protein